MGTAAAPTTRSILPALSCAPAPGLLIDKQRQRQAYMFAWLPSSGRYADKMIHENILVAGGYDQGLSLWSRNTQAVVGPDGWLLSAGLFVGGSNTRDPFQGMLTGGEAVLGARPGHRR